MLISQFRSKRRQVVITIMCTVVLLLLIRISSGGLLDLILKKQPETIGGKPKEENVESTKIETLEMAKPEQEPSLRGELTFKQALSQTAASDNRVLLALVDWAFRGMAVNFYLTCLKPFGISNYVILTIHSDACEFLVRRNINCFFYRDMNQNDTASKMHTQGFIDKMNIRTDFVLEALKLNFSVLHTDIDMFCFKNIMEINCPRESCDIAPLIDDT